MRTVLFHLKQPKFPGCTHSNATHYFQLAIHYLLPTTYYSLLATHYSPLTTDYSRLTTHDSRLTTHPNPNPNRNTTHYLLLLLTIHYSLFTTCYWYLLLTTNYLLLTTHYSPLTTHDSGTTAFGNAIVIDPESDILHMDWCFAKEPVPVDNADEDTIMAACTMTPLTTAMPAKSNATLGAGGTKAGPLLDEYGNVNFEVGASLPQDRTPHNRSSFYLLLTTY